MHRGFVAIWRKFKDASFFKDSYAVHVAILLLLNANHKDDEITFNGEKVKILRGQCIVGRHSLAEDSGIKASTVRNKLALLKKVGFLDIKSNNRYSIVTILKYDEYQNIKSKVGQQIGQPDEKIRTTEGQPEDSGLDTNNNNTTMITMKTNKVFTPPTLEEVKTYFKEQGTDIDPVGFWSYYESIGWIQGKGKPIKNWKACLPRWERNNFNTIKTNTPQIDNTPKEDFRQMIAKELGNIATKDMIKKVLIKIPENCWNIVDTFLRTRYRQGNGIVEAEREILLERRNNISSFSTLVLNTVGNINI